MARARAFTYSQTSNRVADEESRLPDVLVHKAQQLIAPSLKGVDGIWRRPSAFHSFVSFQDTSQTHMNLNAMHSPFVGHGRSTPWQCFQSQKNKLQLPRPFLTNCMPPWHSTHNLYTNICISTLQPMWLWQLPPSSSAAVSSGHCMRLRLPTCRCNARMPSLSSIASNVSWL